MQELKKRAAHYILHSRAFLGAVHAQLAQHQFWYPDIQLGMLHCYIPSLLAR
jgi:hypothetical protein